MSAPESTFTQEQIDGLAQALKGLPTCENASEIHGIVEALRQSKQTVLDADAIESIKRAVGFLDVPLAERPTWGDRKKKPRGSFFVFEGLDRSGKSTQSKRLTKHLEENGPVKWMCFPNRSTPTGKLIDFYLRRKIDLPDHAVHLLFSANRWETAQEIVNTLHDGTSIVCDRYAFSGVAYSAAKGLDFEWCREPDRGLPCPDSIFFMHIDQSEGAKRSGFGDERYENTEMQSSVRMQFQNAELHKGVNWNMINGARDMDLISGEIQGVVASIKAAADEDRTVLRMWA